MFYKIAVLGSSLNPLIYSSCLKLDSAIVVKVPLRSGEFLGVVEEETEEPDFKCQPIIEVSSKFFSKSQLKTARFISEYYCCSFGLSLSIFIPFEVIDNEKLRNSSIPFHRSNVQRSWFLKDEMVGEALTGGLKGKTVYRNDTYHRFTQLDIEVKPTLTSKQKEAVDFVNSHKHSLLFGDTGSGKSEIYIYLISQMLKEGKNAIYLLPEIGLTPQLEARLRVYFGDMVALWHSKLSKQSKTKILQDIKSRKIRVVLGARSSLFLPLYDIGLIVVDEEHDESYKSNSAPRYNARDAALVYGDKLGAKVVLGSATPSVVIFSKIPHFRLKGGFFESKKDIIYENAHNEISPKLLDEVSKTLNQKRQVIIFLPTRANFKYLSCRGCGYLVECPFCSVAMSLHRQINALKCHYCNYTSKITDKCPKCSNETIEAVRVGTAEVVDRLREFFPAFKIEKFDKDEITTQTKLDRTLKKFKNQEIDILVGTQMLSKGHDYHNVGLSVVMGVDSLFAMPDFRSKEKALSLAIQIAGRSGRKEDGKVFIQTKNCEFFERYLQNYDEFLGVEMEAREGLYPPFTRLMRLLISHKNEQRAKDMMDKTVLTLQNCDGVELVGAGKSDIAKIANKYRYSILLRSFNVKPLLLAANVVKNSMVQVDMDPLLFS